MRVSLYQLDQLLHDDDYPGVVDNMRALHEVEEHDECWTLTSIPVDQIDPGQLHDDPADFEGDAKIESIRITIRAKQALPPVFAVHHPGAEHPFELVEGRHRYNACYREGSPEVGAWVAHVHCCQTSNSSLRGA